MSENEDLTSQEDAENGGNWKSDDFVAFGDDEEEEEYSQEEEEEQQPNDSNSIVSGETLPPWMTSAPRQGIHRVNPLVSLHNEIVDFCELMSPLLQEIREREVLVERFRKVAQKAFGANKVRSYTCSSEMICSHGGV